MAYNPYIVVPFATWAIAQVGKFALAAIRGKIDFRNLYASGGMPSVHSAVVSSLVVTAYLVDGPNSGIFGFAAIFAAIVMYDSFGVRRSSGEQAVAINMLIESLDKGKFKLEQPQLHLREILGHQPSEVAIGALLGITMDGIFNSSRLGQLFIFLQGLPKGIELIAYAALFGIILIAGVLQYIIIRQKYRKSSTMKSLARQLLTFSQVVGWLGAIGLVFAYEHASYLSWRVWTIVIILIGVIWASGIASKSFRTIPVALATEQDVARKLKWLTWGKGNKLKRR